MAIFSELWKVDLGPFIKQTLHMLMSHVQLYPRIIVSNSHGDTVMYVDTVTI